MEAAKMFAYKRLLVVLLSKELDYYSIELCTPLHAWRIYSKGEHCSRKRLELSCLKLLHPHQCEISRETFIYNLTRSPKGR